MEFKIKLKIKEREVYGTAGSIVLYKGGYYTYMDHNLNSTYRIIGIDESSRILIQSIGGGCTPYEHGGHHFWKTRWREASEEEIKRFIEYENQNKEAKAQGSQ